MIKVAFFDTKPYDELYFNEICKDYNISIKYFESKLNRDTAEMAKGYDAVCAFVNDNLSIKEIFSKPTNYFKKLLDTYIEERRIEFYKEWYEYTSEDYK